LYSFPTGIEEFDVHDVSYHKSLQNYDSQYSSFYNIPSIDENAKRWILNWKHLRKQIEIGIKR